MARRDDGMARASAKWHTASVPTTVWILPADNGSSGLSDDDRFKNTGFGQDVIRPLLRSRCHAHHGGGSVSEAPSHVCDG
jgi:hypothetical protein